MLIIITYYEFYYERHTHSRPTYIFFTYQWAKDVEIRGTFLRTKAPAAPPVSDFFKAFYASYSYNFLIAF